jgi:RpiR family transcriptional regulator, carbohydrate utilization regulator
MTRSERQVGSWVLANAQRSVDASIMQVAEAAAVSEPTVIRFCRSVGVAGFRELKTRLIAALQRPDSYLHHDVAAEDGPGEATTKVLESSIRALVDLREVVSAMPFEAAADVVLGARQIVFVGLGASGIVAQDACHKFFRLGLACATALDSPTILQQASIARAGDVYVAISHTGHWPELVQGMKLAVQREASVVALTDPDSALAAEASLVFDCHPPEDTNVFTPMSSRLAQLVLLDALQVAVALKMGSEAQDNLRLTKEALILARTNESQGLA